MASSACTLSKPTQVICKHSQVLVPQGVAGSPKYRSREGERSELRQQKTVYFCFGMFICVPLRGRSSRLNIRLHTIASTGFGGIKRLVRATQYVIEFTVTGPDQAEAN